MKNIFSFRNILIFVLFSLLSLCFFDFTLYQKEIYSSCNEIHCANLVWKQGIFKGKYFLLITNKNSSDISYFVYAPYPSARIETLKVAMPNITWTEKGVSFEVIENGISIFIPEREFDY